MSIIKKGDKYGKLTAIKFSHINYSQYWFFRCDCGKEKIISVSNVKRGHTKSCGCLLKGNSTHGMSKTKSYGIWYSMKQRCFDKKISVYKDYGGRGITVYKRWLGKKGFTNFYKDMGDRPENKSLDRIDNNGNYCKENCRWADKFQQANNKRNNCLITYQGKTQTIAQWAEELNIKYNRIYRRFVWGWDDEKIYKFFRNKR